MCAISTAVGSWEDKAAQFPSSSANGATVIVSRGVAFPPLREIHTHRATVVPVAHYGIQSPSPTLACLHQLAPDY